MTNHSQGPSKHQLIHSWQPLLTDRPYARLAVCVYVCVCLSDARCNHPRKHPCQMSVCCWCNKSDQSPKICDYSLFLFSHTPYLANMKHHRECLLLVIQSLTEFRLHSCGALQEFITTLVCAYVCVSGWWRGGYTCTGSTCMNHSIHTSNNLWMTHK